MTPAMTPRREALLALVAIVAVLGVLAAVGVGRSGSDPVAAPTTTTSVPAPTTAGPTAVAPSTTEPTAPPPVTVASAPFTPTTDPAAADPGPRQVPVDPVVEEKVAADGQALVLVDLDVPDGLSPEERAGPVAAAAEEVLAGLPEGSYSAAKPTGSTPALALTVDTAGLDALRTSASATRVAEDRVNVAFSLNAPTSIQAPQAWARGADGGGRVIAVLDTGVARTHPYLMRGTTSDVLAEACFSSSGPSASSYCPNGGTQQYGTGAAAPCPAPAADCLHGTHVAGIAAGGTGATSYNDPVPGFAASGIAPDATLLGVQVFSRGCGVLTPCAVAFDSDIIRGLEWVGGQRQTYPGLAAVNLSLGGGSFSSSCDALNVAMKKAIDDLRAVGIATVVASGNDYKSGSISSPACISTAVAVGAVDDATGAVASYSNINAGVDLLAPGSAIRSSIPPAAMGNLSGTSMATPAVAGALAVLGEARPDQTVTERVNTLRTSGTAVTTNRPSSPATLPYVQLNAALDLVTAGVPSAPTSVTGVIGDRQVQVSWGAPTSNGGSAILGFKVIATPGGATCNTNGALTCAIPGLVNGTRYQFGVRARNATGEGASEMSGLLMPFVEPLVTLTPARLMDTRAGFATDDGAFSGTGKIGAGQSVALTVAGRGGVPVSGAAAVALNVTVTGPTASSWLRVYPSGASLPNASNLNFVAGQTVPNMVIAAVGADGKVRVHNQNGQVDVIVDVLGWFPAGPGFTAAPSPARLMDTRSGGAPPFATVDGQFLGAGALGAGQERALAVMGRGPVPDSGVGAVALNVTATGPTASSWLRVYPSGASLPNASNLNFVAGQTVPNMVIAPVGVDGTVQIRNEFGQVDVIVDVLGWFPSTSGFDALAPARLMDTRSGGTPPFATFDGQFLGGGAFFPNGEVALTVVGRGPVPDSGVGSVALNVTVTGATTGSWLRVYSSGATLPNSSNLNFGPGQTLPNMVIAAVGADGKVRIHNQFGRVHVIVDVLGWAP